MPPTQRVLDQINAARKAGQPFAFDFAHPNMTEAKAADLADTLDLLKPGMGAKVLSHYYRYKKGDRPGGGELPQALLDGLPDIFEVAPAKGFAEKALETVGAPLAAAGRVGAAVLGRVAEEFDPTSARQPETFRRATEQLFPEASAGAQAQKDAEHRRAGEALAEQMRPTSIIPQGEGPRFPVTVNQPQPTGATRSVGAGELAQIVGREVVGGGLLTRGGLATLPGAALASAVRPVAALAQVGRAAIPIRGATATLGRFAQVAEEIPSVFGFVAKATGRSVASGVRVGAEKVFPIIEKRLPTLAGKLQKAGGYFRIGETANAVADRIRQLQFQTFSETNEAQEFARSLEELVPNAADREAIVRSAADAGYSRFERLQAMKDAAAMVPGVEEAEALSRQAQDVIAGIRGAAAPAPVAGAAPAVAQALPPPAVGLASAADLALLRSGSTDPALLKRIAAAEDAALKGRLPTQDELLSIRKRRQSVSEALGTETQAAAAAKAETAAGKQADTAANIEKVKKVGALKDVQEALGSFQAGVGKVLARDVSPKKAVDLYMKAVETVYQKLLALADNPAVEASIRAGLHKLTGQIPPPSQIAEIMRVRRLTVREFAQELPDTLSTVISQEARDQALRGMPVDHRAVAEEIFQRFSTTAARRIAAGADPAPFRLYEGVYVPELYKGHEIKVTPALRPGAPSPTIQQDLERELFERRPLPTEDKVAKGLVLEPQVSVGKGLVQEVYDANVGEFFKKLADDSRMAADAAPNPGWSRLLGKKYGALNGKYVHPAVRDEITEIIDGSSRINRAIKSYLRYWRGINTVLNPPVHFGNIAGNVMLMDAGGLAPTEVRTIAQGIRSLMAKDETFKQIRATGLLGGTYERAEEYNEFLQKALKRFEASEGGGAEVILGLLEDVVGAKPKSRLAKLGEIPGNIYQAEETLFKYLVAHKAMTKGIATHGVVAGNAIAAARHAEKWLFNYADVPLFVRDWRGAPSLLAAPFITFQMKAAPRMAEVMMTQPHKLVKYHLLFEAANAATMAMQGVTPEQYEEYRKSRAELEAPPAWRGMASLSPVWITPFNGPDGKPMAMDLARWTPMGAAFRPAGVFGMGPAASAIHTRYTGRPFPGGPMIADPRAPESQGGHRLPVSAQTRLNYSVAQQLAVPPVATRAATGILAAMGPEYGQVPGVAGPAPTNIPAYWLERLGRGGAVTPQGTVRTPLRQFVAATIGAAQEMDLPSQRQRVGQQKMADVRSFVAEGMRSARGTRKAQKAFRAVRQNNAEQAR